jgi:MFS transporter, FSR family, fosmidomycin resistance protein
MNSSTSPQPAPVQRDAEVITLVGVAHGTSHFFHLLLPPLFPWLMADFSLGYTQAGFLMTVFFVVSGIGQALAGFVVDRIGARPVLLFGIGTLCVSALLLHFVNGYAGLLAVAAVAGLGNSIFHPADFTLLNRNVAQARLGHAFSMHGLAGNLGWAAASLTMAGVAVASHWRNAALVAFALGLAVLLLLFARRKALSAAVVVSSASGASEQGVRTSALLRSAPIWLCFVFFLITTGPLGILQNFAPAMLAQVYGLPLPTATLGLTAYLLGASAGIVLGGFVATRAANADVSIAVMLALSASVALLVASGWPGAAMILPLMALIGVGIGAAGPSRDLLVRQATMAQLGAAGQRAFGRVYGFVYSGLDIGLAATPLVFGPMLDAGHYSAPLVAIAVLLTAALALALAVGSGTRRNRQRTQEART